MVWRWYGKLYSGMEMHEGLDIDFGMDHDMHRSKDTGLDEGLHPPFYYYQNSCTQVTNVNFLFMNMSVYCCVFISSSQMKFLIFMISTIAALPFQLSFNKATRDICSGLSEVSERARVAQRSAVDAAAFDELDRNIDVIKGTRFKLMCFPSEIFPFFLSGLVILIIGVILVNVKQIEDKRIAMGVIGLGAFLIIVPTMWYVTTGLVSYLRNREAVNAAEKVLSAVQRAAQLKHQHEPTQPVEPVEPV